MNTNGVIDLGSQPENYSTATVEIVGSGDEGEFKGRCMEKLKRMEVLSYTITKGKDGSLVFEARVRSQVGLPGYHRSVEGVRGM